jgi:hypothetical protein
MLIRKRAEALINLEYRVLNVVCPGYDSEYRFRGVNVKT